MDRLLSFVTRVLGIPPTEREQKLMFRELRHLQWRFQEAYNAYRRDKTEGPGDEFKTYFRDGQEPLAFAFYSENDFIERMVHLYDQIAQLADDTSNVMIRTVGPDRSVENIYRYELGDESKVRADQIIRKLEKHLKRVKWEPDNQIEYKNKIVELRKLRHYITTNTALSEVPDIVSSPEVSLKVRKRLAKDIVLLRDLGVLWLPKKIKNADTWVKLKERVEIVTTASRFPDMFLDAFNSGTELLEYAKKQAVPTDYVGGAPVFDSIEYAQSQMYKRGRWVFYNKNKSLYCIPFSFALQYGYYNRAIQKTKSANVKISMLIGSGTPVSDAPTPENRQENLEMSLSTAGVSTIDRPVAQLLDDGGSVEKFFDKVRSSALLIMSELGRNDIFLIYDRLSEHYESDQGRRALDGMHIKVEHWLDTAAEKRRSESVAMLCSREPEDTPWPYPFNLNTDDTDLMCFTSAICHSGDLIKPPDDVIFKTMCEKKVTPHMLFDGGVAGAKANILKLLELYNGKSLRIKMHRIEASVRNLNWILCSNKDDVTNKDFSDMFVYEYVSVYDALLKRISNIRAGVRKYNKKVKESEKIKEEDQVIDLSDIGHGPEVYIDTARQIIKHEMPEIQAEIAIVYNHAFPIMSNTDVRWLFTTNMFDTIDLENLSDTGAELLSKVLKMMPDIQKKEYPPQPTVQRDSEEFQTAVTKSQAELTTLFNKIRHPLSRELEPGNVMYDEEPTKEVRTPTRPNFVPPDAFVMFDLETLACDKDSDGNLWSLNWINKHASENAVDFMKNKGGDGTFFHYTYSASVMIKINHFKVSGFDPDSNKVDYANDPSKTETFYNFFLEDPREFYTHSVPGGYDLEGDYIAGHHEKYNVISKMINYIHRVVNGKLKPTKEVNESGTHARNRPNVEIGNKDEKEILDEIQSAKSIKREKAVDLFEKKLAEYNPVAQVYSHNGAKFDTYLVSDELLSMVGDKVNNITRNNENEYLDIGYNVGTIKYSWKDSFRLTQMKLEDLGKTFAGDTGGKLPFNHEDVTLDFIKQMKEDDELYNKIKNYNDRDVDVMFVGLMGFRKYLYECLNTDILWSRTMPSFAMKNLKLEARSLLSEVAINDNLYLANQACEGGRVVKNQDYHEVGDSSITTEEYMKALSSPEKTYRRPDGKRININADTWTSMDLVSQYPSAMILMPGFGCKTRRLKPEEFEWAKDNIKQYSCERLMHETNSKNIYRGEDVQACDGNYRMRLVVNVKQPQFDSMLPNISKICNDGTKKWCNEPVDGKAVDDFMLRNIYHYNQADFEIVDGFIDEEVDYSINFFMKRLFAMRQEAKKNGNKALDQCLKIFMNSAYGQLILRLNNIQFGVSKAEKSEMHNCNYLLNWSEHRDMDGNIKCTEYKALNLSTNETGYHPHGAAILGFSKFLLSRIVYHIENTMNNDTRENLRKYGGPGILLYSDTDCMYIRTGVVNYLIENTSVSNLFSSGKKGEDEPGQVNCDLDYEPVDGEDSLGPKSTHMIFAAKKLYGIKVHGYEKDECPAYKFSSKGVPKCLISMDDLRSLIDGGEKIVDLTKGDKPLFKNETSGNIRHVPQFTRKLN